MLSLFSVFAVGAAAQSVPPPTLSGESFHDGAPTPTSVTCSISPFVTGGTFEARGTATGPYPGTFQETGSLASSGEITASFTIDSSVGHVTGTKRSMFRSAACDTAGGWFSFTADESAQGNRYDATIVSS